MLIIYQKLKNVKQALKLFNATHFGDIHQRVGAAREIMFCKQKVLIQDETNEVARQDKDSLIGIKETLSQFASITGFNGNTAKSQMFMCGIEEGEADTFNQLMHMQIGQLPLKYLKVWGSMTYPLGI